MKWVTITVRPLKINESYGKKTACEDMNPEIRYVKRLELFKYKLCENGKRLTKRIM